MIGDKFPMPIIEEIIESLSVFIIFKMLDMFSVN